MIWLPREFMIWLVPVACHVEILRLMDNGTITRQGACEVLDVLWERGLQLCRDNRIGFR